MRPACCAMIAALGAAPFLPPAHCDGQTMRALAASRTVGTARSLHVDLDFSGGALLVVPAAPGTLYDMRLRYDAERYAPVQQFDSATGRLQLGLRSIGGLGIRVTSRRQLEQTARVEFAPDVPLDLSASVGTGDASIDLGGMALHQLEVQSTASHTTIDFSRPATGACQSATFIVAASQIEVQHAAQAGCALIRVRGGAGGASLTFNGDWQRDVAVDVDLAMGSFSLLVPRGTGVRVSGERFLAPLADSGFVRSGDNWTTPGYAAASHRVNVTLKASMVRIDVKWIGR